MARDSEYPIILVLGVTGTGKSSFIKSLMETSDEEDTSDSIGHGLEPHTLTITERLVTIGEEKVILVDTPGLDYPGGVFEAVIKWMSDRHNPIRSVNGIVLLHPINRNRMTEDSISSVNLRRDMSKILRVDLDSRYPFYTTVLATTMWIKKQQQQDSEDLNSSSEEDEEYSIQTKRERELQQDRWRILNIQGAMFRRYDNTSESAKEIVLAILRAQSPGVKTTVDVRDHLIIAVIGSAQAGKTSFINTLTGSTTSPQESTFGSGSIEAYEIQSDGINLILLDTPGLDSVQDPEKVFKLISEWLKPQAKAVRKPRLYLDGIIVVHPILSDHDKDKSKNIIEQSILMNQVNKFFGGLDKVYDERDTKAYHRVVLVTTMWDKLGVQDNDLVNALKMEERIQKVHWNIMRAAGAPSVRFKNTTESARNIVNMIVEAKKLGDPLYHYRKTARELDQVRSDTENLREEMGRILEEEKSLRQREEILARIPNIWRASFLARD